MYTSFYKLKIVLCLAVICIVQPQNSFSLAEEEEVKNAEANNAVANNTVTKPSPKRRKLVNLAPIQQDLQSTCEWLKKDGQVEVLRTLLIPYESPTELCRTCNSFAKVWLSACKPPRPKIDKKKAKSTEPIAEGEESSAPADEETPEAKELKIIGFSETPSTELIEVFSKISRKLADNDDWHLEIQDFFSKLEMQAPNSSKLYINTLSAFLSAAWPEPDTEQQQEHQAEKLEIKEKELEQLF